ncbi:hypothetical protein EV560_102472 [Bosea sp. BK604]|nr:hypothetical protein EV560_102472 [Bosea sp. BK604]
MCRQWLSHGGAGLTERPGDRRFAQPRAHRNPAGDDGLVRLFLVAIGPSGIADPLFRHAGWSLRITQSDCILARKYTKGGIGMRVNACHRDLYTIYGHIDSVRQEASRRVANGWT